MLSEVTTIKLIAKKIFQGKYILNTELSFWTRKLPQWSVNLTLYVSLFKLFENFPFLKCFKSKLWVS